MGRVRCHHTCAYCIENRQGRCNHKGHRGFRAFYLPSFEELVTMKRPESMGGIGHEHCMTFADEAFIAEYPVLYSYLTDTKWEDGNPRETTTVLLCVDAGVLKAWVNDRALARSAWVSADSLQGLFRTLEAKLATNQLEWRLVRKEGKKR